MPNINHQQMRDALQDPEASTSTYTEEGFRDYIQTLCLIDIAESLKIIAQTSTIGITIESGVAVSAQLLLGENMSTSTPGVGSISVDTVGETVAIAFYDDKGDVAEAPTGAVVSFASDNPAVLTVTTDAANALVGDITLVAEGTANISATISGASAPDGSPFTVAPVAVNVVAGEAATAGLSLEAPVAAPAPTTPAPDTTTTPDATTPDAGTTPAS